MRAFGTASKRALEWKGATPQRILDINGAKGQKAIDGIRSVEHAAEEKYPGKASYIKIQGTKLHPSHKDPNETQNVITVSVHTANHTRLLSGHVREDGSSSVRTTRNG